MNDPSGEQVRRQPSLIRRALDAIGNFFRFEREEKKSEQANETGKEKAVRQAKQGVTYAKYMSVVIPKIIINLPNYLKVASKVIPAFKKIQLEPVSDLAKEGGLRAFHIGTSIFMGVELALDIKKAIEEKKKTGTVRLSKIIDITIKSTIFIASVASLLAFGVIIPFLGTAALLYGVTRAIAGKHIDKFIDNHAKQIKKAAQTFVNVHVAVAKAIAAPIVSFVKSVKTAISSTVSQIKGLVSRLHFRG